MAVLGFLGCSDGGVSTKPDASQAVSDAATTDEAGGATQEEGDGPDATFAVDTSTDFDGGGPLDSGAADMGDVPAAKISLPADDSLHPVPNEWWYWTGHLQTATGRWLGFEEVFFRASMLGQMGTMFHVAVTDIDARQFHVASSIALGDFSPVANGVDFSSGTSSARGGNGSDHLHGEVDGYVFDLQLAASKAPVLQHEQGYTAYPWGGYTYYYSRERMTATGSVTLDGATVPVTGTAWFDHQWGDMSSIVRMGWDWFALQLDDNTEIMLFLVRDPGGQVLVGGSMSRSDGVGSSIAAGDVAVTPVGQWTSPRTGCTYPSGWNVQVRGQRFTVTPVLADQELSTTTPKYWEGACTVSGPVGGRAYVELTGYCP